MLRDGETLQGGLLPPAAAAGAGHPAAAAMLQSLRAKLTIAFTLITFLTVLLTTVGVMLLLREREELAARERVGQLGNIVEEQVRLAAGLGWQEDRLAALINQFAEDRELRLLLINGNGDIITDTGGELSGMRAEELTAGSARMRHSALTGFSFITWQDYVVFVPAVRGYVRQRVTQDYSVRVLVPEADIAGAWEDLLPRIALSGGVALVGAVAVALLLSRSITRPVVSLTRASEEMAKGHYDQRIEVESRDEIGRLARSFNQMAHEVSRTHQAMRDLNGNVAHELKTPLTSIQGYSQAMLDGLTQSPAEIDHAARVINDEAERMRRLVEDLLYLSRLESGQLQIERQSIDVPSLLKTAVERIEWQAREGGRTLDVRLAIDIPRVLGDIRRLEQVLANLLENALRHTPASGRITLTGEWSREWVRVRVHNSGSYIAPEHLSRIFQRFYQVDPARTRDGHHGGLGLAIAAEIVAAHGGSLTAASSESAGTEFTMTLPADHARPDVTPQPTAPARRGAPPT